MREHKYFRNLSKACLKPKMLVISLAKKKNETTEFPFLYPNLTSPHRPRRISPSLIRLHSNLTRLILGVLRRSWLLGFWTDVQQLWTLWLPSSYPLVLYFSLCTCNRWAWQSATSTFLSIFNLNESQIYPSIDPSDLTSADTLTAYSALSRPET